MNSPRDSSGASAAIISTQVRALHILATATIIGCAI